MEIVTYLQLNNDILANLYKIPKDIDLIVGVPRSGLLVANLLALYLNKPMTDVEGLLEGRIMAVGNSKSKENVISDISFVNKILLVEDSILTGNSIRQIKDQIKKISLEKEIIYLAAYITTGAEKYVDIFFKKIDDDRVFEWNYIHNRKLKQACFDIDGVLCYDPTPEENDDGENYLNFISNAIPKLIPTRKIGYIVTSRLEKYREPTERWLEKNGIQYGELYMMQVDSAEERRKMGAHGVYKAKIFSQLNDATWFVESDQSQAEEIASLTGKSVLCVGGSYTYNGHSFRQRIRALKKRSTRKVKSKLKEILPESLLNFYKRYFKSKR